MSGFLAFLRTDGQDVPVECISRLAEDMAYRGPSRRNFLTQGAFAAGISVAALDSAALYQHDGCTVAGTIRLHARADLLVCLAAAGIPVHAGMQDAALVLHAYAAWGAACAERLLGDFAFVIWDAKARRLLAVTDRFGVRPIYYAQTTQGLLVSNSIATLLASGLIDKALDERAVADFLAFGVNSDPAGTIYTGIRAVPPAHLLLGDASRAATQRYWSVPAADGYSFRRSIDDYADELLDLLRQAVADRLPAEGSIHLTLSGGMDSGSIAGTVFSLLGPDESKERLKAHTIVYRSLITEEEGHYANLLGDHLGISPQILTVEDYLFQDETQGGAWKAPQPGPLYFLSPEYQIARRAQANSGRVLTGFGGDPLFLLHSATVLDLLLHEKAAAPITIARHALSHRQFPSFGLRRRVEQRLRRQPDAGLPLWIDGDFARRTDLRARAAAYRESNLRLSPHAAMSGPFWRTLFAEADPGHLGIPIEASHPFFDSRIMDFLVHVPGPLLRNKFLLRHAMRNILPEEILRRPKTTLGLAMLSDREAPRVKMRQHRLVEKAPGLAAYVNISVLRRCIDRPQRGTSAALSFAEQLAFWLGSA